MMSRLFYKPTKGFTIVEVMIAIAVAGMVMGIVFLAVPSLERNQRDSQRKTLALRLKSELETYASNHQGSYPFTGLTTTYTQAATGSGGSSLTPQDFMYSQIYNLSSTPTFNLNDPSSSTATNLYFGWDTVTSTEPTSRSWALGRVYIAVGDVCSGNQPASNSSTQVGSASSKQYALAVALELSNTWYCVDNQ